MRVLTVMMCVAMLASAVLAADLSHEIVYRMSDGRQYAISNPQQAFSNMPLILYYHGINTPCTKVTGDILDAIAAQNFPALVGSVCGSGGQWDINGQSDIDYTHRVLNDIASKYSIDRSKVFLTGWSMGGMMCSRIACKDGGIAAGIAMVDCAFACDNFAVKTNLMGVEAIYDSVCVNWISPAYADWATKYGCPSAGSGDTRRQTCNGKYVDLDRLPAGHNYIDVPNQVAFFKKIAGNTAPCDSNPCAAGQLCTNNGNSYTCGANVAIGQPASISSVGNWCSGSNAACLASYAVDGDYSQNPSTGKCAHSGSNTGNQWLRVDLGTATVVSQIRLFLRTDCCSERANGYAVYLSNSDTAWDSAAVQIGSISQQQPTQVYSFTVPANTAAYRYVEVRAVNQWLAVCELAVITPPHACVSSPCVNGGTCTETSTGYTCGCAAGFAGSNCETCSAGFTQFVDSDAPNNDVKTIWGVTSYADCQAQCAQTAGCAVFTFNSGLQGCWIKNKLGTAASAPGFIVGVCKALLPSTALPCASSPCVNGGTCGNLLLGGFSCACPTVFSGPTCAVISSVAQLKPTSMSGVGNWCNGASQACSASYAVDNNYGQSLATGYCAHSGACTGNQYWRVDLGAFYHVSQVSLYLRTDCCTTRAVGYGVYLTNSTVALDANAVSIGSIAAQTTNQVYAFTVPATVATGQFVEVRAVDQCLTICEAAVLGTQA